MLFIITSFSVYESFLIFLYVKYKIDKNDIIVLQKSARIFLLFYNVLFIKTYGFWIILIFFLSLVFTNIFVIEFDKFLQKNNSEKLINYFQKLKFFYFLFFFTHLIILP